MANVVLSIWKLQIQVLGILPLKTSISSIHKEMLYNLDTVEASVVSYSGISPLMAQARMQLQPQGSLHRIQVRLSILIQTMDLLLSLTLLQEILKQIHQI